MQLRYSSQYFILWIYIRAYGFLREPMNSLTVYWAAETVILNTEINNTETSINDIIFLKLFFMRTPPKLKVYFYHWIITHIFQKSYYHFYQTYIKKTVKVTIFSQLIVNDYQLLFICMTFIFLKLELSAVSWYYCYLFQSDCIKIINCICDGEYNENR